jgi:hypothetical protein
MVWYIAESVVGGVGGLAIGAHHTFRRSAFHSFPRRRRYRLAMADPGDYYRLLEVHPEASEEAIRAGYHRLVKKHHPDVSPSAESAALTMRLNDAYDCLRDPVRRARYDDLRGLGALPEVGVSTAHVVVEEVDPGSPRLTFQVGLHQAGGPPYDPSRHAVAFRFWPPWDPSQVVASSDVRALPATVTVTMDLTGLGLAPSAELSGDVEVVVRRRSGA